MHSHIAPSFYSHTNATFTHAAMLQFYTPHNIHPSTFPLSQIHTVHSIYTQNLTYTQHSPFHLDTTSIVCAHTHSHSSVLTHTVRPFVLSYTASLFPPVHWNSPHNTSLCSHMHASPHVHTLTVSIYTHITSPSIHTHLYSHLTHTQTPSLILSASPHIHRDSITMF